MHRKHIKISPENQIYLKKPMRFSNFERRNKDVHDKFRAFSRGK
jgi:hypothetical protein